MDSESRWDLYFLERLEQEKRNLENINPLVEDFADLLQKESIRRVLDLGCGLGRHSHYLAQKKFQVIGCDISGKILEIAEKLAASVNIEMEFVQGDYIDLPFNNEVFGAVLAIDTIHHDFIENIAKAFKEIHRVLAPDGLVCMNPLSVGDKSFGEGRKLGEKLYVIHRIPHYFFDIEELEDLLERTFFKVEILEVVKFNKIVGNKSVCREQFKVIARKLSRRRAFFTPSQRIVF